MKTLKILYTALLFIFKNGILNTLLTIGNLYNAKGGFMNLAFQYLVCNRIKGDYLEFGVYRGRMFISAMQMSRVIPDFFNGFVPLVNKQQWVPVGYQAMRFFAFDSFQGMPESFEEGKQPEHQKGGLACSEDEFLQNLKSAKVNLSKVVTVPGFFDATLRPETKIQHNLKKAAFIYIDCDLYESARVALEFCTDLIIDGTIIAFDDWNLFNGNPELGE